MEEPAHDLADLILEFLAVVLAPEARERLEAEAAALGGTTYEQFLAMSLSQLITERFELTPIDPSDEMEDDADGL